MLESKNFLLNFRIKSIDTTVFYFYSAMGKSAQLITYFVTDAMEGPTPVSA
jgi:NADH:ubiquinone oxidoreductase subunit 5 (subunit L)/multisubunit Na+/H+ antiporter MnhA subunit